MSPTPLHVMGKFTPGNQLEVELPVNVVRSKDAPAQSGIGDTVVGIKHVLFFNLDPNAATGSILSVQGELSLPTGSRSRQLGTGQTAVGCLRCLRYAFAGKRLPSCRRAAMFLAPYGGGSPPRSHTRRLLGSSFSSGMGLGRLWSPMLEVVANRDLQGGAVTDFDVIPQFEVTLSARQHVSANLAYRIALNDTAQRLERDHALRTLGLVGRRPVGGLVMNRWPLICGALIFCCGVASHASAAAPGNELREVHRLFQTSDRCFACHNGLTTRGGQDVSISSDWRSSAMANSSRDPYWQVSVRRETIDHSPAAAQIEDECSICHVPMSRYAAKSVGQPGRVFAHLPFNPKKLASPTQSTAWPARCVIR